MGHEQYVISEVSGEVDAEEVYRFSRGNRCVNDRITPKMLRPQQWLDDYEGLLQEGEDIEDDMTILPSRFARCAASASRLG